ncbi:MAG TPA: hypothetical protein PKA05_14975 [Roseiflexaceae bacterium]|nr:hypothetical protein [Roseiflexaceae bacterium]HMP41681.1 hypothetical protein [Roseiflexaceae bacterium]
MNRFWQVIAYISLIFPFAAVGYKMAITETPLSAVLYAAIIVILVVTVGVALRAKPTSGDHA